MKKLFAIALVVCLLISAFGAVAMTEELTLDTLKQRAQDAGLRVEEMHPMQMPDDEAFVAGFGVSYDDTILPIMEWETEEAAAEFAEAIDAAGYNVAIRSGRFLSMCTADNGVVKDTAQKEAIEGILGAKASEVAFDMPTVYQPIAAADYSGAFSLSGNMLQAMQGVTERLLAVNNNLHPEGDPLSTDGVISVFFGSMTTAFSGSFSEDEAVMQETATMLADMLGMEDMQVVRNSPNEYTLDMKMMDKAYQLRGFYDPATGAFRCEVYKGSDLSEFLEFVPLGEDTFAFQNGGSRALAVVRDGALVSFTYAAKNSDDKAYTLEADGIYPSASGLDASWVAPDGSEKYNQYFAFDGATMIVDAKPIGGDRVQVEIPLQ